MNSFNLENLQSLTPIEFENLVKTLLQQMGFNATTTKVSGDGGIDIIALNEQPIVSGKYVIQCKRYAIGNNIGEPVIRELYGVMMHENANKGILITTSDFSKKAISFAQYKAIELINGDSILSLLNKYLDAGIFNKFSSQQNTAGNKKRLPDEPLDSRFEFTDYTIVDKVTRLTWTRDALGIEAMSWKQANEFIQNINSTKYAGYGDWRLPNKEEVETPFISYAIHKGLENKKLYSKSWGHVFFWSSTTYAGFEGYAWVRFLFGGSIGTINKDGNGFVWPVRTGEKT